MENKLTMKRKYSDDSIDQKTKPNNHPSKKLRLITKDINEYIDYTNLKVYSTYDDIDKLCKEASLKKYYTVCIPPSYISYVRKKYPKLRTCVVIGFPLGYSTFTSKKYDAYESLSNGADEIDVVWNLTMFKNKEFKKLKRELKSIKSVCDFDYWGCDQNNTTSKKILKVIVEVSYLSKEDIRKAVRICSEVGVDFIKTSTGFSNGNLNTVKERQEYLEKAIEIMYSEKIKIGSKIKIKASGSIKDEEFATSLILKGADRIGTSLSFC